MVWTKILCEEALVKRTRATTMSCHMETASTVCTNKQGIRKYECIDEFEVLAMLTNKMHEKNGVIDPCIVSVT